VLDAVFTNGLGGIDLVFNAGFQERVVFGSRIEIFEKKTEKFTIFN